MKKNNITVLLTLVVIIAACHTAKKGLTSTTTPTTTGSSSNEYLFTKPTNGSPLPGNEELVAIQTQYKDVTLDKLKEGHSIYTEGACINCHGSKNINDFEVAQWKDIIEDMAQKAEISDAQKDAIYKYVLSVKAVNHK